MILPTSFAKGVEQDTRTFFMLNFSPCFLRTPEFPIGAQLVLVLWKLMSTKLKQENYKVISTDSLIIHRNLNRICKNVIHIGKSFLQVTTT